ncbi:hypothetical protein SPRG_01822 [Saprolegnia parasitica CBS 223.65]|uniref:SAM domain-containing protein n=1 Tax=Saprolegnia parasitica (strain CBS 223.65) TaxID=695850 RepID=A0A067CTU5_SAPPC|nr:hypothetical protein SPRG_01822 [Saprolegnia parasitica CBS 223.65]KDO33943.1 hypothetical protein SPRG_01822 [Saprolegnia parasitica CBS 223.65]|eukprot:XP_012195577.1 hypothetical protein SPRG_01822 [Saprolegnia parasitica CBS 223.65]
MAETFAGHGRREVVQDALYNAILTKETVMMGIHAVPNAAMAAPSAIAGAFSSCFSRARRMQFDQDQKRSLLSNLYHDEARVNIRDAEMENAVLELRRRIQKMEYEKHRRMELDQELGLAKKSGVGDEPVDMNPATDPEFTPLKVSDIRKMSVDELLSMDEASSVVPQDLTGSSALARLDLDGNYLDLVSAATTANLVAPATSSLEGSRLRKWLSEVDTNKSIEYTSYASSFEKHGFQTLKDLAQLDEEDVEQALTEIGITKFAHRARLRKAILRLGATP